jgi:hypothetical protein
MFFSGLFFYPESESWTLTVLVMSAVTGSICTFLTVSLLTFANNILVDVFKIEDNGSYLVLLSYLITLLTTATAIFVSADLFRFQVLSSISLATVYLIVIIPSLTYYIIFRASTRLNEQTTPPN